MLLNLFFVNFFVLFVVYKFDVSKVICGLVGMLCSVLLIGQVNLFVVVDFMKCYCIISEFDVIVLFGEGLMLFVMWCMVKSNVDLGILIDVVIVVDDVIVIVVMGKVMIMIVGEYLVGELLLYIGGICVCIGVIVNDIV